MSTQKAKLAINVLTNCDWNYHVHIVWLIFFPSEMLLCVFALCLGQLKHDWYVPHNEKKKTNSMGPTIKVNDVGKSSRQNEPPNQRYMTFLTINVSDFPNHQWIWPSQPLRYLTFTTIKVYDLPTHQGIWPSQPTRYTTFPPNKIWQTKKTRNKLFLVCRRTCMSHSSGDVRFTDFLLSISMYYRAPKLIIGLFSLMLLNLNFV